MGAAGVGSLSRSPPVPRPMLCRMEFFMALKGLSREGGWLAGGILGQGSWGGLEASRGDLGASWGDPRASTQVLNKLCLHASYKNLSSTNL